MRHAVVNNIIWTFNSLSPDVASAATISYTYEGDESTNGFSVSYQCDLEDFGPIFNSWSDEDQINSFVVNREVLWQLLKTPSERVKEAYVMEKL